MPRFSIPRGALNGAASGGSKLFQAIVGADKAYQDGYDKSALAQARIDQAESTAAKSAAAGAQDEAETRILQGRPDVFNEAAAARSGKTIAQVQAYRNYLNTGYLPERQLPGPPTEQGVGPGSAPALDPETMTAIGKVIGQIGLLQGNVKDLNPNELAGADQKYGDMGLRDDILAGRRKAGDVASAQRAVKAGDLFKQAANGSVIDVATGDVDQDSPIAQAVVKVKTAQAAKTAAGSSGKSKQVDTGRIAILGQQFFDNREKMASATGDDLKRRKGDELGILAEIRNTGFKGDVKALKDLMAVTNTSSTVGAEVRRQIGGIISVQQDLAALEEALKDFNPRSPADQTNLAKRARITSLAKQAQLNAKEAAALGALSGPDMGLLEGILADPNSPRGILFGGAGVAAQLKEARLGNERRIQALKQQYGNQAIPNLPSTAQPVGGNPSPGAANRNYRVDY